jgi:hypothetical protein
VLGFVLAAAWLPAPAANIEVPLHVRDEVLGQIVAAALGLDAAGRGVLVEDHCNQVVVSDLRVETTPAQPEVDVALEVSLGAPAFGGCVGPRPWRGRMRIALDPGIASDGLAILFTPSRAELTRPDGSSDWFSRPTGQLAEALVLPALGRARLDLAPALAQIDALLHGPSGQPPPDGAPLSVRARIVAIEMVPGALRLGLAFAVAPPGEASPEPPLGEAELAAWQRLEDELDGFLTHVVLALAEATEDPDLQIELLGGLLDARHAIGEALADEADRGPDPVRRLFVDAWDRLRPLAAALAATRSGDGLGALELAAFLAGGDALRALEALGPDYGVEISRDGLRRLARILLAEAAPPAFTPLPLEVDPRLRALLRLPEETTAEPEGGSAGRWTLHLIRPAQARRLEPARALHRRPPEIGWLEEYLGLVEQLLGGVHAEVLASGRLDGAQQRLFGPMVQATAWKESCWRQWAGPPESPRVLTSPIGAVGLMQVNPRVWRGAYDVERLKDDIRYNAVAGARILEHYLVDYALRRGEHRLEGGLDNLVRATYAAYNGGPGQMSRYRREDTPPRLRAIDRAFWAHFERIRAEGRPDPASCYPV